MHITYDPEADAAYIRIGEPIGAGRATQQVHSVETPGGLGELIMDFDDAGRLLGIEVLSAAAVLAPEVLARATAASTGDAETCTRTCTTGVSDAGTVVTEVSGS